MSVFNDLRKNNKAQVLWEGHLFFCLLDGFPISPGHSLIIPNREVQSITSLTQEEWLNLKLSIDKTIETLSEINLINKYEQMQNFTSNQKSIDYIQQAIDSIKAATRFSPDAYNHGVNDGVAAGRTLHHLHWHVIPRFTGDVKDPTGGIRFIFPDKANYRIK